MRLKDQVAIVTGGARGVGEAIAKRLTDEGAKVLIGDINFESAKEVADSIKAEAVAVDVTDPQQCAALAQKALDMYGRIDLLVCNAGLLIARPIEEFDSDAWRKVIDVNLVGYFNAARAVVPIMMRQKKGNIIQINSKSGKKGSAKNSAFAASKFGGIGLTQSLALELASYNIRVNAICPGNMLESPLWVENLFEQYARNWGVTQEEIRERYMSQVPLGRSCYYDDVTNLLVFLASDQSSYMTGQAVNVTGGQEMR